MAEEGSVTIECMTLRGDGPSPVDPTGCPKGTAVTLPAKDGYKDGESWGATWNGEKQMATWTQAWGGLYLGMNNADWSGYKDLYIKFDGEVPAKLIVDVNGNGNNDPQEISGGDHIIIPIQGNKNVDFSKVECLCFKLAAKDSVKIQCMTLRGGIGTDTEEVTVAEDNVQKMIENGQLILIRDGVRYNAQGQILK